MPIGIVDPWGGYEKAVGYLQDNRRQDLMEREMADRERSSAIHNQVQQAILGEHQRKLDEEAKLQRRLDSLQPYYTQGGVAPTSFLGSIQPQTTNEFGGTQAPATPFQLQQPTNADRLQVMADEAARGNQVAMEQAPKAISANELVAKMQAMGDPVKAAKTAYGLGLLKSMITELKDVYATKMGPDRATIANIIKNKYAQLDPELGKFDLNGFQSDGVNAYAPIGDTGKAWVRNPDTGELSMIDMQKPDNSHNTIRVPSADGKTEQIYQYNPQTKKFDIPVQNAYAVKSQVPSVNVTTGAPQQTQFVDPQTGNPMVFDKKTGTYKVAKVEGAGGVAPRPVNPSAGEREKSASLQDLKNQITEVDSIYKANPNYVGFASGRVGALTAMADENEEYFRTLIKNIRDTLLRARSGAQINEQEYKRLSKLVPDYTTTEKQFQGRMDAFNFELDSIITEREKSQAKGGVAQRGAYKKQSSTPGKQIAPAGTQARLKDGRVVTSDGKGGWN